MNIYEEFLYNFEMAYGRSDKTIESYQITLHEFNQYLFNGKSDIAIEDIKELYADDILIKYLKVKESEGLKPSSLNARVAAIRSFYKWLLSRGLISLDISKSIPTFKNPKKEDKETLDLEECWKLLDYVNFKAYEKPNLKTKRMQLIVNLFLGCGLRIEELSLLENDCFDLENRRLNLTKTKFKKRRTVSVPDSVLDVYKEYMSFRVEIDNKLDESLKSYLFISQKLNVLSTDQIRRDIYKVIKECDLKKITVHSLRHSYAQILLSSEDVELHDLAFEMGHSSIATTMRYVQQNKHKNLSEHNPIFNKQEVKEVKKESKVINKKDNVIQLKFA